MPVALNRVVDALGALAPLHLAEDWDNVGLLVEPKPKLRVRRGLLTIDLTDAVLEEAIAAKVELIVAYHPPIFGKVSRLVQGDAVTRRVLECARRGIAMYSPHTALDAVEGGVNDWLADALGRGSRQSLQIREDRPFSHRVSLGVGRAKADAVTTALEIAGCAVGLEEIGQADGIYLIADVPSGALELVRRALDQVGYLDAAELVEIPGWPRRDLGVGRRVDLAKPIGLEALVRKIKKHLGLSHVRLARAPRHEAKGAPIESIALCAGAGGSVLEGVPTDLYWTGEMRHHDVLAAQAAGTSVVLCEHTNTERGYLPVFAERLDQALGGAVDWVVSARDADPLRVV